MHCPLPPVATELWLDAMCLQSGIWAPLPGGDLNGDGLTFLGGSVVRRNEDAWEDYHDLWFLFGLAREDHRACFPARSPFPGGFGFLPPVERVSVLYPGCCAWRMTQ